jgi:Leucine-rich repeat (LRR) protein
MKSLLSLHLENNKLTSLPDGFENLTNLKMLFMCKNNLTELPVAISNLKMLEWLGLSDNQLVSLPDEIDIDNLPNLRIIGVANNRLDSDMLSKIQHVRRRDIGQSTLN